MKTRLLLLLTILLALHGPALGQHIVIRISIKVIVDPMNGTRPLLITDALLNTAAASANNWMASYSRGYRFRIMEITNIGGPLQGGVDGPSKWFGKDPRSSTDWQMFQSNTQSDGRYLLRPDQVNFYVTQGPVTDTGGACPIPPGETGLTACWGLVNGGPWWLVHETGHFFGLYHTFGDDIADTLPDRSDWTTQDEIANNYYGMPYSSLDNVQRNLVDDTFFNVMSYHNALTKDTVENRMTELQLDRHADTANSSRAAFVSGRTHFVSPSGSDSGTGSGTSPYRTLSRAITAANDAGGNILLLRPGAYNQALTINKPCTLRATRVGPVSIGTAVSP